MFLYHVLKREHIDFDCNNFLTKFLEHIYRKTVKMHFVELMIYDDSGQTIYFPKLSLLCREYYLNSKTLVKYLGTLNVFLSTFFICFRLC